MENVSPAQGDQPKDVAEQTEQTTTAPVDVKPQTETKTETVTPKKEVDDDEDSDFDELDDVLDDFSKPKPAPAPAPAPAPSSTANPDESTGVAPANFDEDAFLKQLEAEMANMMGGGGAPPGAGAGAGNPADFQATVDQGADVFAKQLEESGIPPGDFLKQLLADVMAEEGGGGASAEGLAAAAAAAGLGGSGSGSGSGSAQGSKSSPASTELTDQPAESFNDAIKRTMGRMKESGDKATAAASSEDDISDDMLAQLLKAVEAGAAGAGDEGDLSKMFMGMMEQLSNKEMLYEPMKELDGKFGPWLVKSKAEGKVSEEDMGRYETQAKVVKQIVGKFEENGYSDDDPKCREYVWERMQEMQAAGSPPEELVSNPLMEDLGGLGAGAAGAPGMPDCPQQ